MGNQWRFIGCSNGTCLRYFVYILSNWLLYIPSIAAMSSWTSLCHPEIEHQENLSIPHYFQIANAFNLNSSDTTANSTSRNRWSLIPTARYNSKSAGKGIRKFFTIGGSLDENCQYFPGRTLRLYSNLPSHLSILLCTGPMNWSL